MVETTTCDVCDKELSSGGISRITTIKWWSPHWDDTHLCSKHSEYLEKWLKQRRIRHEQREKEPSEPERPLLRWW